MFGRFSVQMLFWRRLPWKISPTVRDVEASYTTKIPLLLAILCRSARLTGEFWANLEVSSCDRTVAVKYSSHQTLCSKSPIENPVPSQAVTLGSRSEESEAPREHVCELCSDIEQAQ